MYNFGSPMQIFIGLSCKPFKYDFSVSWEVSILMEFKVNIIKQVVKSYNKNKKIAMKKRGIVMKFNEKVFIFRKSRHLDKGCRNKNQ
jgi:hypothetical protein